MDKTEYYICEYNEYLEYICIDKQNKLYDINKCLNFTFGLNKDNNLIIDCLCNFIYLNATEFNAYNQSNDKKLLLFNIYKMNVSNKTQNKYMSLIYVLRNSTNSDSCFAKNNNFLNKTILNDYILYSGNVYYLIGNFLNCYVQGSSLLRTYITPLQNKMFSYGVKIQNYYLYKSWFLSDKIYTKNIELPNRYIYFKFKISIITDEIINL